MMQMGGKKGAGVRCHSHEMLKPNRLERMGLILIFSSIGDVS